MILPIYLYGSQVLRAKAQDADLEKKEEILQLISDMKETMLNADGCGLAAPQVGVSQRIVIVDGRDLADRFPNLKDFTRTLINPQVIWESEETAEYGEGCLSIPNVDADITRPASLKVRYIDENFNEQEELFQEFAARMVQHELDHLDGIVFTDRASQIRKKMIAKKLYGISKGCVRTHYRVKTDKK